jgi:hypothetical protein
MRGTNKCFALISIKLISQLGYMITKTQQTRQTTVYGYCSRGEPLLIVTEFVRKGALIY